MRSNCRFMGCLLHTEKGMEMGTERERKKRQLQDSNLRGQSPTDFESVSLTTRTSCLVLAAHSTLLKTRNRKGAISRLDGRLREREAWIGEPRVFPHPLLMGCDETVAFILYNVLPNLSLSESAGVISRRRWKHYCFMASPRFP